MSNPFESAKRKIARAKKHIDDVKREVVAFTQNAAYIRFSEPDTKNPQLIVHKVRMNNSVPDGLSEIAGDALANLRQALDHATYGAAIASGKSNPRSAYFPFGRTESDVDNAIKGNCKDVPQELYSLLRAFKPHSGGNEVLYTLSQMANRDKHALLTPVGATAVDAGMNVSGTGYMSMPDPHFWDHAKNEMVLITLGPGAQCNAHFRFFSTIAFSGISTIESEPAPTVLDTIASEVDRVISLIEEEARRLKFIP
jgi:hypothetical protein